MRLGLSESPLEWNIRRRQIISAGGMKQRKPVRGAEWWRSQHQVAFPAVAPDLGMSEN